MDGGIGDAWTIIGQIAGMVVTLASAVWFLSTKIQRLSGDLNTAIARMESRLENHAAQLVSATQMLDAARASRADIWKELNTAKERIVVLETRLDIGCPGDRNA